MFKTQEKLVNKVKSFLKILGPGFITGASDDDPSGIATYAQTGAQFGYSQLWTALFAFPFMTVIQEICGRIGVVTGDGLAGVLRKNYAKPILYGGVLVLILANTINVGADLGAMASSAQLILGLPFLCVAYFYNNRVNNSTNCCALSNLCKIFKISYPCTFCIYYCCIYY